MDTNTAKLRNLWAYLTEHPTASIREVSAAMGCESPTAAWWLLRDLESTGYVERWSSLSRACRVIVPLLTQRSGQRLLFPPRGRRWEPGPLPWSTTGAAPP